MNIYKKTNFIWKDTELLVSSLVIFACLFLAIVFPVDNNSLAQLLTKNVFFLVVIPALYIKLILKKNLADFGLNIKNKKTGVIWGIFFLVFLSLLYYALFNYTSLPKKYTLPQNVANSFPFFLLYELVLMNILIFSYEFFFRGFVQFLFFEKIGYWTILFQSAIFILFSSLNNGFFWQLQKQIIYFFLHHRLGVYNNHE
jgi:membrane protease YdiL (CAAX protease family)